MACYDCPGFADLWEQVCETYRKVPVGGDGGKHIMIEQDDVLTGTIWDCGLVMCDLLTSEAFPSFAPGCWRGKRVIELGCGTGVVGIALALAGAEVVLTDIRPQVANIQANVDKNVELHPELRERLHLRGYHWGEDWEGRPCPATTTTMMIPTVVSEDNSSAASGALALAAAAGATGEQRAEVVAGVATAETKGAGDGDDEKDDGPEEDEEEDEEEVKAALVAPAEKWEPLPEAFAGGACDVILCSDLLYDHGDAEEDTSKESAGNSSNRLELLASLLLLAGSPAAPTAASAGSASAASAAPAAPAAAAAAVSLLLPEVIIGLERRKSAGFEEQFFAQAKRAGFAVTRIHHAKRRPDDEDCNFVDVFRMRLISVTSDDRAC